MSVLTSFIGITYRENKERMQPSIEHMCMMEIGASSQHSDQWETEKRKRKERIREKGNDIGIQPSHVTPTHTCESICEHVFNFNGAVLQL